MLDLESGEGPRLIRGASFTGASPLVEGDACHYCSGPSVYRASADGRVEAFITLPEEYVAGRHLFRLATHLTVSADGKYFLLDGQLGNEWFAATGRRAT